MSAQTRRPRPNRAAASRVVNGPRVRAAPRVCLVFSGPGSQYPGMGRALYEREPVFRDALGACAALLDATLPRPLVALLYDEPSAAPAMDQIELTQPIVFAFGSAVFVYVNRPGMGSSGVIARVPQK